MVDIAGIELQIDLFIYSSLTLLMVVLATQRHVDEKFATSSSENKSCKDLQGIACTFTDAARQ